jgi:hypothetical protein
LRSGHFKKNRLPKSPAETGQAVHHRTGEFG